MTRARELREEKKVRAADIAKRMGHSCGHVLQVEREGAPHLARAEFFVHHYQKFGIDCTVMDFLVFLPRA